LVLEIVQGRRLREGMEVSMLYTTQCFSSRDIFKVPSVGRGISSSHQVVLR
jgi:hypothetical protein